MHVFQKGGEKVTDIPKSDIRNKDLASVERLLESYVLDSPETFYDNYDTLLPKEKRKELGSYFTKKGLAGFAQYFLYRQIKDLSDHYVVDPAAGSGTLLAGLRAKSVFGTDKHEFKYALMRERGVRHFNSPVDFLTTSPAEYVNQLNESTAGGIVKNPLLVFSNPPYLGHSSPDGLEGSLRGIVKQYSIRSHDLCSYFLVQMARLFSGDDNGTGEDLDGYIASFSPTTWIYEERGEQREFREYLLSQFTYEAGFRVDGARFFDDMGQPVLFSLLKRRKKPTWNKDQLKVPMSVILDLTRDHALVKKIGQTWIGMPDIVKNRFESIEAVVGPERAIAFAGQADTAFNKAHDSTLTDFVGTLPRFCRVLRTSSSQTGGNDDSLTSMIIKRSSDVEDAISEYRRKLKLRLQPAKIAEKMRLVYDDRSSYETGYRFVYCDKTLFNRQAILDPQGPVLNYFEEVKKSHRKAKFYNLPPVTTDIAVAEVASAALTFSGKGEFSAVGFKDIEADTKEAKYLAAFSREVGDLRSIIFIRAFLSSLDAFRAVTRNKSIDSDLVWLPNLDGTPGSDLRTLSLIAFCHSVSTTEFKPLIVSGAGKNWEAVDYFNPTGWLKSAGLMESLFENMVKSAPKPVATAARAALSRRLEGKTGDEGRLLEIGEELFGRLFLPTGRAA